MPAFIFRYGDGGRSPRNDSGLALSPSVKDGAPAEFGGVNVDSVLALCEKRWLKEGTLKLGGGDSLPSVDEPCEERGYDDIELLRSEVEISSLLVDTFVGSFAVRKAGLIVGPPSSILRS